MGGRGSLGRLDGGSDASARPAAESCMSKLRSDAGCRYWAAIPELRPSPIEEQGEELTCGQPSPAAADEKRRHRGGECWPRPPSSSPSIQGAGRPGDQRGGVMVMESVLLTTATTMNSWLEKAPPACCPNDLRGASLANAEKVLTAAATMNPFSLTAPLAVIAAATTTEIGVECVTLGESGAAAVVAAGAAEGHVEVDTLGERQGACGTGPMG
jgi:hypothetical protein